MTISELIEAYVRMKKMENDDKANPSEHSERLKMEMEIEKEITLEKKKLELERKRPIWERPLFAVMITLFFTTVPEMLPRLLETMDRKRIDWSKEIISDTVNGAKKLSLYYNTGRISKEKYDFLYPYTLKDSVPPATDSLRSKWIEINESAP